MDFDGFIKDLSNRGDTITDGDYIKNGLYYCHVCDTPKQCRIEVQGKEYVVSCICKCRKDQISSQERLKRDESIRLAKLTMITEDMLNWDFGHDDGAKPKLTEAMKRYCDNFERFKADGKGIMLYGPTGTGKTFYSLEIFNELMRRGERCYATTISKLVGSIKFGEETELINRLSRYDILFLDDFSAERKTEYMQETVYNIINGLYEAKVPLILTTNLTSAELRNAPDITFRRTYSRIKEMCHPILVDGEDRRTTKAKMEYSETKNLLGI